MTPWKLFTVRPDKSPLPNCAVCATAGSDHDREACTHLNCHGFYAATDDPGRWTEMLDRQPDAHWAVRTGAASGIIVLDAEGGVQGNGMTGLESLDDFEAWTGGLALPATDLIATTPSGGVHRYYGYVPGVRSKSRVLPGVDVKSDGGYVLIPQWNRDMTTTDRRWVMQGTPGHLGDDVVAWLTNRRGGVGGATGGGGERAMGYDYDIFHRDGCPGGYRDEFANELLFRLRKSGVARGEATQVARRHWSNIAQPPRATYYMPWHHWEYKIERIWRTVTVDEVTPAQRLWLDTLVARPGLVGGRIGRVTLAGGQVEE